MAGNEFGFDGRGRLRLDRGLRWIEVMFACHFVRIEPGAMGRTGTAIIWVWAGMRNLKRLPVLIRFIDMVQRAADFKGRIDIRTVPAVGIDAALRSVGSRTLTLVVQLN